jgi:phosphoribosylanthranilate isomerase
MTIAVKICGVRDEAALTAAVQGGTAYIGFVFFPKSRNAISIDAAAPLAKLVPPSIIKTGLFVDATDAEIQNVLKQVPLDLLQLHGTETPERIAAIKTLTALPVMKAMRIGMRAHLAAVPSYAAVADRLLFDSRIGDEPSGGPIDWALLKDQNVTKPWMLAGGLNAGNLADAVAQSGATAVDVSSGVEDAAGNKSAQKICAFLAAAARI